MKKVTKKSLLDDFYPKNHRTNFFYRDANRSSFLLVSGVTPAGQCKKSAPRFSGIKIVGRIEDGVYFNFTFFLDKPFDFAQGVGNKKIP
ncbi:hypothetical protein H4V97_003123 [Flavobacterium sp. CG_23.5]|uniref:hypothetical protein n=1 Tax=Flavobacterium sp. CG_23.5 TaxID=2760708 RepID=UPI001AE3DAB8|nr:hypothetical protein [Flavobacterium sp. CG_23.5]MBP2284805.1 hypothetical protein [Flavobacterium sp. CG_23.5]